MRFLTILMCSILWNLPAFTQTHRYKLDFTLSAKNFVDTIPIEFENNQIYIPVNIGGSQYRFNLDTGCSQGVLYTDNSKLHGKRLGKIEVQDANGKKDSISAVRFPDFTIGNITIHNYCGTLHNPVSRNRNYDAIIGFDLFNKGLSAKIDVRRKIMVLTDRKNFLDNEQGYIMPYRLLRFVPHVKLSPFHDCTDEALFDSGSRRLYVMGRKSKDVFIGHFPDFATQIEGHSYGSRSIGSFGAESNDDIYFLHINNLKIGGFTFSDYHTLTTQGYSRIGGELFSYGSIVICPRRKRIIFQPYNNYNSIEVSNTPTEIAFIPTTSGLTIGLLWEGSDYYKQGLRQGDRILKIDDKPILSLHDYQNFLFVSGRSNIFTVLRQDGSVLELPIISK